MKYYIVNTNRKADPEGHDERTMLKDGKVSLYFEEQKEHIKRLKENDIVFLYSSGCGFIACGPVDGKLVNVIIKGWLDSKMRSISKNLNL